MKFIFYPTFYILQVFQNEETLAVGKFFGSLYILNALCFSNVHNKKTSYFLCDSVVKDNDYSVLWHHRLGHAPHYVLEHLNLWIKFTCFKLTS